tara:strand:- start:737 stop:907 length:171 start_codon:yes stop_codon:yes gene_type:complete
VPSKGGNQPAASILQGLRTVHFLDINLILGYYARLLSHQPITLPDQNNYLIGVFMY